MITSAVLVKAKGCVLKLLAGGVKGMKGMKGGGGGGWASELPRSLYHVARVPWHVVHAPRFDFDCRRM
jgi:hypothetical protein